jgi:starch phosphorylase
MTGYLIPRRPEPELEIPELYSRLRDIVYNLWWTWSPEAHRIFDRISSSAWRHYRNPIDVLIDAGPVRWRTLADDGNFARDYHALVAQFDAYVSPSQPTWFDERHADRTQKPFAYFCAEFGWHECLHIYSGGLGVLAGDHCKSASDLGLPFVGVGLMYKHGYFRQSIDAEGFQQHFYPDYDLFRLPLRPVLDAAGKELHVPVEFPGRSVHVRVWSARVGRVPVLLLDSDLPINHPADRPMTSVLYVRGREMRLCQEFLLGIGGALTLEALNITPAVWHINEGPSALLNLQRARRVIERSGGSLQDALQEISANTLFTTHTPVPAGNEVFESWLMRKYLTGLAEQVGVDVEELLALGRTPDGGDSFNITALALRTSRWSNGVSELHGRVADGIWRPLLEESGLPAIEHVTNGVHPLTWIGPDVRDVLIKHLGSFSDPGDEFAQGLEAIPDHELWSAHVLQKRRLISMLRERDQEQKARQGRSPDELREVDRLLDPDVLTVGFARRFATYKRADLLLRDPERLNALVGSEDRPVQFVFAGKAHPADRPGQDMIRRIYQASRSAELRGRVIFTESYDMRIARHLVQGVDLWLNTPRRPHEASGTSGMKAAVNGVLNCSILDGWWCEGYDPSHGWVIGSNEDNPDEGAQDAQDSEALYRVLVDEIVPIYYDRNEQGLPAEWIRRMKRAMASLTPQFSSSRMVREYVERFYLAGEDPGLAGASAGDDGRNRTDD